MKYFNFFLAFVLVALQSVATVAQSPWILQRAIGLFNFGTPQIGFSAVNENICWGNSINNSHFIRTTDGGTNWTVASVTGATGLHGSGITAIDASTAWVAMNDPSGATSGGIFKTIDGGLTWVQQETAFQGIGGKPIVIHFFDLNNGVCVGNVRDGYWEIYTTSNGGELWSRIPSGNIPPPLTAEVGILEEEPRGVGNSFWFHTYSTSLYRTTDRGMTWTVARNIIGGGSGFGFAFKDSLNGLACTLVGGNKISRTSDGGVNWESISFTGLSNVAAFYIQYAKGTSGSYIITSRSVSDPGSAYSNNNGEIWKEVDLLMHGPAVFPSALIGWSGGKNDSVYKWDSGLLTSVKQVNIIAESFNLEQNYPNPFNPSTTIKYSIPTSEFVTLKVFDVLGNEVATLLNEEKPAGSYEVEFSVVGTSRELSLSSGIYFYTLQAGSYTQTKKLILIK